MQPTPKPIPGLKAIVFDLDGTLARSGLESAAALARALVQRGDLPDPTWPERDFIAEPGYAQMLEQVAAERFSGAVFPYGAWAEALQRYLVTNGAAADQASEIVEDYVHWRVESIELRPGVHRLLERLSGFRLGLLTNGPSRLQWRKIELLKLGPLFAAIIVSGDRGIYKPAAAIFQQMSEELEVRPQESAYVGDSLYDDIAGAKGAGWWAIWLNSGQRQPDPQLYRPDRQISALEQLPDLLDGVVLNG
ncbi:MAG TPA: HAD family hydrolase [Candidatus Fraserbacteria bacterium]|nr:HAD family hydrolase [Candidatus Fraserbacteria bacterium]